MPEYTELAKSLKGKYSLDEKVADAIAYTNHALASRNAEALAAGYHGMKGEKQNPESLAKQAEGVLAHVTSFLQSAGEKPTAQDWTHASTLTNAMYQHLKAAGIDETNPLMQAYKSIDGQASANAKGYAKGETGKGEKAKSTLKQAYAEEEEGSGKEKAKGSEPIDQEDLFPADVSLDKYFGKHGAKGSAREQYEAAKAMAAQGQAKKEGGTGKPETLTPEQWYAQQQQFAGTSAQMQAAYAQQKRANQQQNLQDRAMKAQVKAIEKVSKQHPEQLLGLQSKDTRSDEQKFAELMQKVVAKGATTAETKKGKKPTAADEYKDAGSGI